jgi:hypothetical protein
MNEIRTLMEKFWICRDSDKETFYKVKRDIPNFQRFIREQLGWKLIHTEKLLKLEKRPAHAEAFMGISEFTDIRDYCILCVVLPGSVFPVPHAAAVPSPPVFPVLSPLPASCSGNPEPFLPAYTGCNGYIHCG